MALARTPDLARWRALFTLLLDGGRARLAAYGFLVLLAGLLPTVLILATGRLVAAIPQAVAQGPGSGGERRVVLALAALVGTLAALSLVSAAMGQLARVISDAFVMAMYRAVTRVTLGTPGVAPLEDPAVANELQAVHDAERRGVLQRTLSSLTTMATTRLRGAGAAVVLLAFAWWAPLLLAVAWYITNRVYLKSTENGVTVLMDGAGRMRRAEYLRSLAVGAPAAKEVRVFGLGGWLVERYGQAWMEALGAMWKSRSANRGFAALSVLALVVSHGVVLAALGMAAARGEVTPAALLVFVQAVISTGDLGVQGDPQWHLAQGLALAARVAGLRQRVPAGPPRNALAAGGTRGKVAVRLDGVRFTYRTRERPTLDGFTLEIPAGQSVAIVGENGAGKSTLIKLLCGLYEPDAGRITLDGGLAPGQARGRVAAIFQDFVRYALPLRENVGFGHLALLGDQAALDGALRDAGGAGVLAGLAKGWDTVLSREFKDGADLSGGQWQRVALARALTAVRGGAGLLILDEPTAALDVRAETELFERFLELTRDVTTILVSHRLSSVRHADRIVVIDGGRVAEDGTHESLMRAGGRYARMYSLQAERFAAATAEEAGEEAAAHA